MEDLAVRSLTGKYLTVGSMKRGVNYIRMVSIILTPAFSSCESENTEEVIQDFYQNYRKYIDVYPVDEIDF